MREWRPNAGPQESFLRCPAFEALYGGAAGGGKISRLDAVVWTPFGPKAIGDVEAGDQICAPDGGHARVLLAHPIQRVKLYRLTFSDGASTVVGEDHLWYAWIAPHRVKAERRWPHDAEQRRGKVWTTAQLIDVMRKSDHDIARGRRAYRPIIPLSEPVSFTLPRGRWSNPRTVPPYTLGVLLGDGTITPTTPEVTITGIDPLIMWEVGLELPGHRVKQVNRKSWRIAKSRPMRENLRDLGALGYSHTKSVPRCYQMAPVNVREGVLQGLMDTDGTVDDRGHASFTSTSKQLATDVQWLARSLGFKSSMSDGAIGKYKDREGKVVECRTFWNVGIQGHDTASLFRLPRKRARCRAYNGGVSEPGRRLDAIEYVGKDEARCITVDHPSGLFVTDDFIVTHNSEALMIYPTRWITNPNFRAIIFRRTIPELKRYLVERTPQFYRPLGGVYNSSDRKWLFPSGAVIELGAMQHVKDRFNYDSVEYQVCIFDELTTFERSQYTYMITRMRTTDSRVPIRLRAATNPGGPGHDWVLERFAPWLYTPGEHEDEWSGPYASPGETVAFAQDGNEEHAVDIGTHASTTRAFFPATIDDNPAIDAEYKYRLELTDALTYAQKKEGDWMARPAPGLFFRRDMFAGKYLDIPPKDTLMRVRHWDLAATADENADPAEVADKGPDWTAGVLVSIRRDLTYVIEDVARARVGPDEVEAYLAATADQDREEYGAKHVLQSVEEEGGASGKIASRSILKALRGHWAMAVRPTGSKVERAKPAAGQCRAGNVWMVRGPWNRVFISEGEAFPFGKKDQIDGFTGAMGELMRVGKTNAKSGGRRKMPGRMGGY